jgi:REP element-mobilizing transposase RayT
VPIGRVEPGYRRQMPRVARNVLADYRLFHVSTRSAGGCPIFVDELDRLDFADRFWKAVLELDLKCLVACQVGTHYHAVFETELAGLSTAMLKLNGSYARTFNERHRRHGHLFGSRFMSRVIESERHLRTAVLYVLWNPVRAGLCSTPEEWEWSWVDSSLGEAIGPELAAATGGDSPMGQSLRRVRERQERARLKRPGGTGMNGTRPLAAAVAYRERDVL